MPADQVGRVLSRPADEAPRDSSWTSGTAETHQLLKLRAGPVIPQAPPGEPGLYRSPGSSAGRSELVPRLCLGPDPRKDNHEQSSAQATRNEPAQNFASTRLRGHENLTFDQGGNTLGLMTAWPIQISNMASSTKRPPRTSRRLCL